MSFRLHLALSKSFWSFPGKILNARSSKFGSTIGELSHIDAEQLRFCYESIAKETPLEGSILTISIVPAMVSCPHCTYRGRPDYWDEALAIAPVITMRCPQCGKAVDADQGHECAIKSVRLIETHVAPSV